MLVQFLPFKPCATSKRASGALGAGTRSMGVPHSSPVGVIRKYSWRSSSKTFPLEMTAKGSHMAAAFALPRNVPAQRSAPKFGLLVPSRQHRSFGLGVPKLTVTGQSMSVNVKVTAINVQLSR